MIHLHFTTLLSFSHELSVLIFLFCGFVTERIELDKQRTHLYIGKSCFFIWIDFVFIGVLWELSYGLFAYMCACAFIIQRYRIVETDDNDNHNDKKILLSPPPSNNDQSGEKSASQFA